MERYQRGDRAAFETLFSRHGGRVFGFLMRATGDRALAEDLLQHTFLNLHRARESYRAGAPFAPWLYTIANNARRDAARERRRGREDLTADGTAPEAAGESPHDAAGDEEAERVRAALEKLPEAQREVIVLHRWHGLSFAEIAEVVGASEGAVKVRAHRGYLALRDLLSKPADDGPRPRPRREGEVRG
jgi:RNA polymerase sigma-70 factor (ECF subfamily)